MYTNRKSQQPGMSHCRSILEAPQVVQPFSIFPPSPDSTCVVFSHAHSEQIRLLIPPLAICHRFSRRLRAALIAQAVG
jgi:hypothetical protein